MQKRNAGEPRKFRHSLPSRVAGCMFVYDVVLLVLALYFMLIIWPKTVPILSTNQTSQLPTNETVTLFKVISFTISSEVTFLLITMVMGALGALVYSATRLVAHVAYENWKNSLMLWYLMHPILGSSLAVGFYAVVRGGLVSVSSGSSLNLYGIAAFSFIVGLSSKQATQKLTDIIKNIFGPTESSDQSKPAPLNPPTTT